MERRKKRKDKFRKTERKINRVREEQRDIERHTDR